MNNVVMSVSAAGEFFACPIADAPPGTPSYGDKQYISDICYRISSLEDAENPNITSECGNCTNVAAAECGAGEVLTGHDADSYTCTNVTAECGEGEVVTGRDGVDSYTCANVTAECGDGEVVTGRDGVDSYICTNVSFSCPAGHYLVARNGNGGSVGLEGSGAAWECKALDMACGAGLVMTGISNGVPDCVDVCTGLCGECVRVSCTTDPVGSAEYTDVPS